MSNNYQTVINLVKEMSGTKNTIGIPRIYIKITKGFAEGAFLSQIVFWADNSTRTDGFFWKSAKEWKDELELSYSQVTRLAKKLEKAGFIETKLMRANGAPTMHYRPNMDRIIKAILEVLDFQESRKSEKSNLDIEDSRKSIDFQESRKSITEREKTTEKGDSCNHNPPDYLETVVNNLGQVSEESASPTDQWLGYRDEALRIFDEKSGAWGRTPQERQTRRERIGELAGRPDFDPARWERSIIESINAGVGAANISRFIEVYELGGNYQAYLNKQYPGRNSNGNSANGTVIQTSDGGYYV